MIDHLTTEAEREALNSYASECAEIVSGRQPIAVEIGSYQGGSSVRIAEAIAIHGGKLYCIDLWDNHPTQNRYKKAKQTFLKNVKDAGLSNTIEPVQMDSASGAEYFASKQSEYDFIFIDGDHSYAAVKRDFNAWQKYASQHAVFAFHDCNPLVGYGKGPERFTQEIIDSGKYAEIERVDSLRFLESRK